MPALPLAATRSPRRRPNQADPRRRRDKSKLDPETSALRYQHATAKRDEAIADGINRLLEAARENPSSTVVPFRSGAGADSE
jgi:hypothetical protein